MWKVFEKLKTKITGAEGAKPPTGGLEELEKSGMMGQFFRHWKNPAFLKQARALAARMQAEGINLKDAKAVQDWLAAHKKEVESGAISEEGAAKPQTFVKTGPDVGRNDPCPCGSGKKHKKCCGK